MTTPTLLALDTATDQLAAGLLAPGVQAAVNAPGGALASARLIPLLMGLLRQHGLTMPQVQAVAFGQVRSPGCAQPVPWPRAWPSPTARRCCPSTAC